ncbi:type II secretion system protein GspG [Pyxidicoccus fallax]|uniref:Type II secretion system protein GspG n=1 Tax=Pyxidicoccus fallax TaxID=394095 RepID=A0A848LYR3_9BACT|nr:type II secretion system protein GspG [Pyxidicoccus fallax]NMO22672.1 type II secretion system protein GspG [Pyxidicoccus fallax]NPC84746.1 type II secretion system protein GspG [Pyxidicoccus fallax]
MERRGNRGQTAIEMWIILIIIGLIAGAVTVVVLPKLDAARRDSAALDLKNLKQSFKLYAEKRGCYPDAAGGLRALVEAGALELVPKDPWKRDYVYRAEAVPPVILSYGEDGEPGGEGIDADISLELHPITDHWPVPPGQLLTCQPSRPG